MIVLPRYPIYIPSKGRADACLTARFLIEDGVPFHLVVEPQEQEAYAGKFGEERVLVLPFSNMRMGPIPARNWIKEHAIAAGCTRHWQLDDNIKMMRRMYKGKKIPCSSGVALGVIEDFTDRYDNIAISGPNYTMFGYNFFPPFFRNIRIYSCSLILNSISCNWRGRYNEDADICLQVLSLGWCTLLVNVFTIDKVKTMSIPGGNTEELYQDDGRLRMARSLERMWPGVVTIYRRFQRPQHRILDHWRRFDTPLKLKPGINIGDLSPNEYGMILDQVKPVKSDRMRRFLRRVKKDGLAATT